MSLSEAEYLHYYNKYFPFSSIREWISCKGTEPLENRECSFWFDDERFTRWNHIDQLTTLLSKTPPITPQRMEIGPIYSHPIKSRFTVPAGEFRPVQRELVFDIDADDFKEIKHCCGASEICERCWLYMECALNILDVVLRENFGFKNILYVFSGRRGVHLWICDKKAREMDETVRKAIVKYLNLKETLDRKQIHNCPLAQQMLSVCEPFFCSIAEEQQIFTYEPISKQIESLVGRKCFDWLQEQLQGSESDFESKWRRIKSAHFTTGKPFETNEMYYRLVFFFTFPRLDANVTQSMNHLLKSPFSIHPKSGLLSLPIPRERFSAFPPSWVPSLKLLLAGDSDAREKFSAAVELFDAFRSGIAE